MLYPQITNKISCLKGLFPEYIAMANAGIDQTKVGIYTFGICFFQNREQSLNDERFVDARKYAEQAKNKGTAQFKHCLKKVDNIPLVESKLQEVVVCMATTIRIAIPLTKSK